jgi:hypothetical protein
MKIHRIVIILSNGPDSDTKRASEGSMATPRSEERERYINLLSCGSDSSIACVSSAVVECRIRGVSDWDLRDVNKRGLGSQSGLCSQSELRTRSIREPNTAVTARVNDDGGRRSWGIRIQVQGRLLAGPIASLRNRQSRGIPAH